MILLKRILAVVGLLVLLAASYFVWEIGPRNIIGILRYDQRREGDLKVGDIAPDVKLAKLDGSGDAQLLDPTSKLPLIIIFGSYT
jgi:hypothetical protein